MFDNVVLNVIVRYLHIVMAIALLGGTIFMRFVLLPAADELTEEDREKTLTAVRTKWSKVVMVAAGFLLLSGLYNMAMVSIKYSNVPKYYNALLGVKILLALIVFFVASMLAGRSEIGKKMRQKGKFWLHVNFVLASTVVLLASVVKVTYDDRKPKEKDVNPSTSQVAPLDHNMKD